jgi:hypothetical protein
VKDLKLLLKDYPPIAKNALTSLVNISDDPEVIKSLVEDDAFMESLFRKITVRCVCSTCCSSLEHRKVIPDIANRESQDAKDVNVNLACMLLANIAKSPNISKLLSLQRAISQPLSSSANVIDQLLDCFVKGADGKYNKEADYDYLCYLFADLAKLEAGRKHFLEPRPEGAGEVREDVIPLSKMVVFTEHASTIRRRGVASTIKNLAFEVSAHPILMDENAVNILPYIILPLMGNDEYSLDDSDGMLDECQLLPPDKEREKQNDIICIHLETLLLLTTTAQGRARLREIKVYPIIRELHLHIEDENVAEGCDRLVQILMRDEEGDPGNDLPAADESRVKEVDEDDEIVDIL